MSSLVPAAIWAVLLAGRGRFWSTGAGLPPERPAEPVAAYPPRTGTQAEAETTTRPCPTWPPLAVIVPARNESELLPSTLPHLLWQDYPGTAQVILVDGGSTDRTGDVARQLARAAGPTPLSLTVLEVPAPPDGWAGKPWAMARGADLARRSRPRPEWLLFTDADITHPPGSLRRLVTSAIGGGREAVSLMARLIGPDNNEPTRWERLLLPAFVYFFSQLYPRSWVNDPSRKTAAAAGGCLLVRLKALEAAGGVEAIAGNTIDDVALAKVLKGAGSDIWLGLAGGGRPPDQAPAVQSLRRYPSLAGIWEMVSRNAYTQLGHNPALLLGTLAGMGVTYVAPPLMALAGLGTRRRLMVMAGLATWAAMATSYAPTACYYRASAASGLALPLVASLYCAMTVSSACQYHRRRAPHPDRNSLPSPAGP